MTQSIQEGSPGLSIGVVPAARPDAPVDTGKKRLLARIAAPDFTALARHLTPIHLAHGAILQEEEVAVEWVYFPLSGAVSLLAVTGSGDAIETAIVGCEGAVGLFADFGPWRAHTRAVVQAPGAAERIPLPVFKAAVDQSEPIRSLMFRCKEALVAQTQQTALCNALHSVEKRIARWLLQVSDRLDDNAIPVTQDRLSQVLGVRRTTVTLVAQQFQKEGIIRYRRGRIEVVNRDGLHALACECYGTCRRRAEAVFQVADVRLGGKVYTAKENDRLHYAPKPR